MTLASSAEPLTTKLREARDEWQSLQTEAADIAGGLGSVARDEVRLAIAEVGDGVRATVRVGIWGVVTFGLALMTLVWLPLPILIGLDAAMPLWAASLVTLGILAMLTAAVGFLTRLRIGRISFAPRQAVERFKEDKEWLKRQFSEERN